MAWTRGNSPVYDMASGKLVGVTYPAIGDSMIMSIEGIKRPGRAAPMTSSPPSSAVERDQIRVHRYPHQAL